MSKNKSRRKAGIFTPILWCLVEIMWIITLIVDIVYSVVTWVIIMHAAVAGICLIIAIVYIVRFSNARREAKALKEGERILKEHKE